MGWLDRRVQELLAKEDGYDGPGLEDWKGFGIANLTLDIVAAKLEILRGGFRQGKGGSEAGKKHWEGTLVCREGFAVLRLMTMIGMLAMDPGRLVEVLARSIFDTNRKSKSSLGYPLTCQQCTESDGATSFISSRAREWQASK